MPKHNLPACKLKRTDFFRGKSPGFIENTNALLTNDVCSGGSTLTQKARETIAAALALLKKGFSSSEN